MKRILRDQTIEESMKPEIEKGKSFKEGAIAPAMHEENVRSLLKQARTLTDDVYTRAYKTHQAITKYFKMMYDADLAEMAKDLVLFMKNVIAIKNREIQ
jgi:phage terminase small subunit